MRVIGLAGWSGSGKTTLLTRLLPVLGARGLAVSTLKHAHHAFDIDQPGKDSHAHRQAGAHQVLVSSARRWALITELRQAPEPPLAALLRRFDPVDLLIIEGFKRDPHPKLEVHRAANAKPWLHPGDPAIIGLAADVPAPAGAPPWRDLDDVEGIADLLLAAAVPLRDLLEGGRLGAAE